MNVQNKTKGFTIIEVVLVLAIAGLIFLMVFIALPALQRGQRDTQRKDDLSRVNTQLSNYASNNRGAVPAASAMTGTGSFPEKYLGGSGATAGPEYQDPKTGSGYQFTTANDSTALTVGQINYQVGRLCGTDGATTSGTARQYALRIKLENQTSPYCVDNR